MCFYVSILSIYISSIFRSLFPKHFSNRKVCFSYETLLTQFVNPSMLPWKEREAREKNIYNLKVCKSSIVSYIDRDR